ncbi:MAG: phosphoenolpyruvate carboxykinase (ATP), partial [bacterium]
FTMIHIPEEHQIRQMVLALPENGINICLGSDYVGEEKKGFLRQAMYWVDRHGLLGLHAGTKIVQVKEATTGKITRWGVFLFGLSATGKSTWSCHQLGLDHRQGEGTFVIQDDIVFLRSDGSALGSEANFFVKTDVDPQLQEAMWWALTDKSALYENVMVDWRGEPDFLDERLCANGRAVIRKDKLKIVRDKKGISIAYPSFDMPPVDELDGLIFAFITRRNTVMPFAMELTPQEGVLAYLWGESTHSYASQPEKAGESVRTVGTDPFIVGKRGVKVNRFRDIVMGLWEKYPHKVKFFQYNTGGVGEIIESLNGKKRMVRPALRVPIDLMAAIQRGDLRGTNRYEKGRFGTKEIVSVEGYDLSPYQPEKFYDPETIEQIVADIIKGRRAFTEEISDEGLDREIVRWAEESLQIRVREQPTMISLATPASPPTYQPPRSIFGEGVSDLYRPSRPLGWRIK